MKNNKCKGCGKCCYNVPISKTLVIALKNKIVTIPKNWYDTGMRDSSGKTLLLAETPGGRCPFLTEKNTCNIYDKRPKICKEFGSGHFNHPYLVCPILEGKADTPVLGFQSKGDLSKNALYLVPIFKKLF